MMDEMRLLTELREKQRRSDEEKEESSAHSAAQAECGRRATDTRR